MPANVTPISPIGFLTTLGPRELDTIPLDVVLEESINHFAVVTHHPIEVVGDSGILSGTVSDNAYLEPIVYTMTGVVSDFPISWRLFVNRYANASGGTRSLSAYQILLEHFRKLIPFTLKTPFGDLDNMLFRSFRLPRGTDTKHAIRFRAEIIELLTVTPTLIASNLREQDVLGDQAETSAIRERVLGLTSTTVA